MLRLYEDATPEEIKGMIDFYRELQRMPEVEYRQIFTGNQHDDCQRIIDALTREYTDQWESTGVGIMPYYSTELDEALTK